MFQENHNVKDHTPFQYQKDKVDLEIKRMPDLEIIETSTLPWSLPIVGIEKKKKKR